MDAAMVLACFLPIGFLAVFIGNLGKKFVLYLVWGFIAALPVLFLDPIIISQFPEIVSPAVTVSPFLEEFFKALPIVILALLGSRNSNRDMLVYAMASGIGFSIIENWVVLSQINLGLAAILVRSFTTSLMHGCTCGIIAYGVILIRDFPRASIPSLMLGFYMVAVLIHAFFNLNYMYLGLAGYIVDLFLPLFLFLFLLMCYHIDIPALFRPDKNEN